MAKARTNFSEIPLVDISGLCSGDTATRMAAVAALDKAAREVGFIYIAGHGVPDEVIEGLTSAAKALFALPLDTKMDYYIGKSTNHRGYVPQGEEFYGDGGGDLKEAFDTAMDLPADDPDYLAGNRMLGPNVWPKEVQEYKAAVDRYYAAVIDLGKQLLRGFALGLGVPEETFVRHVTKPTSQLRLIHYWETDKVVDPAERARRKSMGIGAHTDYELFTILLPTAPGLQVLRNDGEWVDAPPVEGTFVNLGTIDVLSTLEFDDAGKPIGIQEKPDPAPSNWAVTGYYCYDERVVDVAENLDQLDIRKPGSELRNALDRSGIIGEPWHEHETNPGGFANLRQMLGKFDDRFYRFTCHFKVMSVCPTLDVEQYQIDQFE